ncbi:hypothetical protein [Kineococcus sp. SYSU DK001]|uniref:hypothetical protein n=1 Tax=Kineococcus sp. SYSU DK001 TaxID=3383122 RepID=UPI003D7EB03B
MTPTTPAPSVRRVVRASAGYDLLVTAGFALPVTAPAVLAVAGRAHESLGLAGAVPHPDPFTVMFANLMGGLVVVWAVFRLLRPGAAAGAADVAARAFFALGMAAALTRGASPLVGGVLVLEVAWAVVQAAVLVGSRRAHV